MTEGQSSGPSRTERPTENDHGPTIRLAPTDSTNTSIPNIIPCLAQPAFGNDTVVSVNQVEGTLKVNKRLEHTIIGPWKKWSRLHRWEKVFLVTCNTALLFSLGITVYKFSNGEMSESDSTYGLILITATLFSFYYLAIGVHQEHPLHMLALVITNVIVWGYAFINFIDNKTDEYKLYIGRLFRLIFTSLFTILLLPLGIYLAWWYYSRETFITFAVASINKDVRAMASRHFTFTSGIMIDVQLQVNFLILVLRNGIEHAPIIQWSVVIVGVTLTIFWSILGSCAVRRESNGLLLCFVLLTFPNVVYAGFKFHQVWQMDRSRQMFKLTLLSGISSVVARLGLLFLTYFVYKDFGSGLKECIYRYDAGLTSRQRGTTIVSTGEESSDTPDVRVRRLTFTRETDSL